MRTHTLLQLAVVCLGVAGPAGVRAAPPVCEFVDPVIRDAYVRTDVSAVPGGYRYDFTAVNPLTNLGCVDHINIEVMTRRPSADELVLTDPSVRGGPRRPNHAGYYTVPGTYSARTCQRPFCEGRVGGRGWFGWSFTFDTHWLAELGPDFADLVGANLVEPGEELMLLTVVSPYPPGPRKFILRPTWAMDDPRTTMNPTDPEADQFSVIDVEGVTIGPVHPDDLALWNGGGQRPADVNGFLAYSYPTDSRTRLPAGRPVVTIAPRYGATIDPATFRAELNGADVTARFAPAAGRHEAVTLPLAAGSNTLILRVDGRTTSGRVATDTDRLVFLVGQ